VNRETATARDEENNNATRPSDDYLPQCSSSGGGGHSAIGRITLGAAGCLPGQELQSSQVHDHGKN